MKLTTIDLDAGTVTEEIVPAKVTDAGWYKIKWHYGLAIMGSGRPVESPFCTQPSRQLDLDPSEWSDLNAGRQGQATPHKEAAPEACHALLGRPDSQYE